MIPQIKIIAFNGAYFRSGPVNLRRRTEGA